MAPPIYSWPASELPDHTRVNVKDEFRKGFDGDLKACELLEMLQYRCEVENPGMRNSPTRCWPVARLFRRCKDSKGTFMVETTAWEGEQKKAVD